MTVDETSVDLLLSMALQRPLPGHGKGLAKLHYPSHTIAAVVRCRDDDSATRLYAAVAQALAEAEADGIPVSTRSPAGFAAGEYWLALAVVAGALLVTALLGALVGLWLS